MLRDIIIDYTAYLFILLGCIFIVTKFALMRRHGVTTRLGETFLLSLKHMSRPAIGNISHKPVQLYCKASNTANSAFYAAAVLIAIVYITFKISAR